VRLYPLCDGPKRSFDCGPWIVRQLSNPAAFAAVLGLFLTTIACMTPPFQGADEDRHFMRAYQLSELSVMPTKDGERLGGSLPAAVVDSVQSLFARRGEPWDGELVARELSRRPAAAPRVFESFPNTALYSPVAYAPQVVGIWIGRLLAQPPVVLVWLARLGSVVTAVVSFILAVRIASAYRGLFVPLFFLPMFAFQTAIVSADCMLLCAAAVLFALTMQVLEADSVAGTGGSNRTGAVAACAAVLLLAKPSYFPLIGPVGLAIVLAAHRAGGFRATIMPALLLTTAFVPALVWNLQVGGLFVGSNPVAVVDPRAQAAFIREQPLTFLGICLASCVQQSRFLWQQFVGVLGWLDTPLPRWVNHLLGCGLVAPVLVAGLHARMSIFFRSILVVTAVVQVVTICGFVFVSWCPVGQEWISGLQGRYFLPLAAFALAAASPDPTANGREAWRNAVVLVLNWTSVLVSMTATIGTLASRHC
jgi:uncharacterized membrane protein